MAISGKLPDWDEKKIEEVIDRGGSSVNYKGESSIEVPKNKMVYLSVRVSQKILDRIEAARKKAGEESYSQVVPSRAEFMRDALIERLQRMERQN